MAIQRKKGWRKYVATQNAKAGGALYKWVQRHNMEPHLTALNPGPNGVTKTVASRLKQATRTWGELWAGGRPHTPLKGPALTPLTGAQIRQVLTKLSGRKAKGPDGWGPKELLTLPEAWTDRLAEFYTVGTQQQLARPNSHVRHRAHPQTGSHH